MMRKPKFIGLTLPLILGCLTQSYPTSEKELFEQKLQQYTGKLPQINSFVFKTNSALSQHFDGIEDDIENEIPCLNPLCEGCKQKQLKLKLLIIKALFEKLQKELIEHKT